jgi:tetratricopeptide (TPR) repeat protein
LKLSNDPRIRHLDRGTLIRYLFVMTLMRTFLILQIFSVSAILAAPSDNDFALHLSKGDEFFRNFDNFSALDRYQRAYDLAPNEFEALVRMTRVHNDIGRSMLWRNDSAEVWYRKAVGFAEILLEKFPDRAESHFWIAITRGSLVPFLSVQEKLDVGKFVVEHARKAVEIDSTFVPAYVILGILYREAAKLKWYERVIANVVFGGSLPGTIEDSEQVLRRAIELDPLDIFAHFELAQTYNFLEEHDRAADHYRTALTLAPTSQRERDQQRQIERRLERMKNEGG